MISCCIQTEAVYQIQRRWLCSGVHNQPKKAASLSSLMESWSIRCLRKNIHTFFASSPPHTPPTLLVQKFLSIVRYLAYLMMALCVSDFATIIWDTTVLLYTLSCQPFYRCSIAILSLFRSKNTRDILSKTGAGYMAGQLFVESEKCVGFYSTPIQPQIVTNRSN